MSVKHVKVAKVLLERIQNLLDKRDDWDQSFFFRAARRKLEGVAQQLEVISGPEQRKQNASDTPVRVQLNADEIMVYVHVYHAQGGRLASWVSLARLVSSSCAGRPIYGDETAVKAVLDKRGSPESEGYFSLKVKKSDLLQIPDDRVMVDALGQELLALKPGALQPDRLCYFSHGRYGYYRYLDDDFVLED